MEIDDEQLDKLREIGNIGAGNASNALSQMTDEKIDIGFPDIDAMRIEDIPERIGKRSKIHTLIRVEVKVEREGEKVYLGTLMLILDMESAHVLAEHLLGKEVEGGQQLTSQEESALKETGNILTGATLSAMTEWVDLKLQEEVPDIKTDMLGAVMDEILLKMARTEDEALVFQTDFSFREELNSYFIFLFSKNGRELILQELSV
ncbi:MAG: chemotaxis protein CheC [Candidatus Nanohalobium sp.]